jgi:cell division protease FtsH
VNQQEPNNKQPFKKKPDYLLILIVAILIIAGFVIVSNALKGDTRKIEYGELVSELDKGHISALSIEVVGGENYDMFTATGEFTLEYKNSHPSEKAKFTIVLYYDEVITIREICKENNITIDAKVKSSFNIWSFLLNLLPIIIMVVFIIIIFKNANKSNNQAFDFAKSRAKLSKNKNVSFKDVAGCDEEKVELEEVIDFLKNPKKYVDLGARIPKGILLVGNPGTGKTLLAKAVAGEANVPFFSISGSDFVEMFVGVGASRVRDLFKVARENAPCIIFIDEIDAVGRQRGTGLGGGHDEREQTLNQLLSEMDGFATTSGIIMIAATNRPDVLDPALLRPGRFDRQITVGLPDVKAREAILQVHIRNKKIDPKIDLGAVAQRIPGFSGADIENLLNEAALLAARDNRTMILEGDIDEGMDRVILGPAKKSKKYSEGERRMVAYHEAGHAVIGLIMDDAAQVQKITIIPRGRAGGYNIMVPKEEKYNVTKDELLAEITGFLGGRCAEEIVFPSVSTGAYNDFSNATAIARSMVTEYGMSDLGPIQYETAAGNVFLGRDYFKDKNFSDKIAHEIDIEVRKIITSCHDKAIEIISTHRALLDNLVVALLEKETITRTDILAIFQSTEQK